MSLTALNLFSLFTTLQLHCSCVRYFDFWTPFRYPFEDHNPCPLQLIHTFCLDVTDYLNSDPENVVAIHCKAGKGRTGLLICSLLVHCGGLTPSFALRCYAERRTKNNKGKYFQKRKSEHRKWNTVVWHFYYSSLFQTCFIVFVTYLLYSKTPKQVFF